MCSKARDLFLADYRTGMYAEVVQVEIGKFLIQFCDCRLNIFTLVMEDHSDDVVRGVSSIFSEIPGFIYKNTEFFQYCSTLNSL